MIFQEGVTDYIGAKIGLQVNRWSPVKGINVAENLSREDLESIGPKLATCIGLALRG